jgi:hypothetical protein
MLLTRPRSLHLPDRIESIARENIVPIRAIALVRLCPLLEREEKRMTVLGGRARRGVIPSLGTVSARNSLAISHHVFQASGDDRR